MRFGYSTNAFVKFTLAESLARIARLGFPAVEIMCDQPHLYPPEYDVHRLSGIKQILDSHHLQVTNLNSFTLFAVGDTYLPSWIEDEPEHRDIRIRHTLECLDIAKFLGCRNISVPPGGPPGNISRGSAMARFYEGLDRVIPRAEALGIKILVEPEPELLLENTPQFVEFIRAIRSPAVGINFDIGHYFCVGEDPAASFETLFEWVGHVHLEDIAATRAHNHLIAGHGVISFSDVFSAMKRLGYTGDISLELYPYVDRPEAAGRESLDYLRPVFREAGLEIDI